MTQDIQARPYSKDYEITDAMFGAFRAPGGARFFWKLFLWTTLLMTAISLVALPPIVTAYTDLFGNLMTADPEDPAAAEVALGGIGRIYAWFGVFFLGYILIASIARAAFFRHYFFGTDDGVFPFRFGGDELRQIAAQLGYWLIYLLATIIGSFVMAIVIGVVAGVAVVGGDSVVAAVIAGAIAVVGYLAFLAFLIWVSIRLLPASALTALRRKVHVFAARKVSANRFWALFGSLLVAGIIAYVVAYAGYILAGVVGFSSIASSGVLEGLTEGSASEGLDALSGLTQSSGFRLFALFAILIVSLGQSFFVLLLAGPPAFFTRQWHESDPTDVFL